MNITLQDCRQCQSKQNSFPHQLDKDVRRGREGDEGGHKEGLFKKSRGGKLLIGDAESETSTYG